MEWSWIFALDLEAIVFLALEMENGRSFEGRRYGLFWGFGGLFLLLLSCIRAEDGVIKMYKDPAGNVNLAPFQKWINAYNCLRNISNPCPEKYKLTEKGWVNVTFPDTAEYCKQDGCGQHTMAELTCIHRVLSDYRFFTKATLQDINDTITDGCANGFNGVGKITSNARKKIGSYTTILLISALSALFLTIPR